MKAVIYLFAPKESDLKERAACRCFMANAGAGRLFWETEVDGVSYSIPFANFASMINLLHLAAGDHSNLAKYLGVTCKEFEGRKMDDRRCLRIKLESVDPRYSPRRFAHMNGQDISNDHFNDETVGSITLMDADLDYKFKKLYFDNFFEAGIAISKVYAAEVYKRIPLQEPSII